MGRVLLLGFASRQIRIQFSQNDTKQPCSQVAAFAPYSPNWIRAKRAEKYLTPYQLAAKMGIPSALIRSWENGASQPDHHQLECLAKVLQSDKALWNLASILRDSTGQSLVGS